MTNSRYDTLRQQREANFQAGTGESTGVPERAVSNENTDLGERLSKLELTVNTIVNTVNSLQAAVNMLTANSLQPPAPTVSRKMSEPSLESVPLHESEPCTESVLKAESARKSYMRQYMRKHRRKTKDAAVATESTKQGERPPNLTETHPLVRNKGPIQPRLTRVP